MGVYIWNRLPSEYQEVEYIGRNGNNYIDTGWIPNINNVFEIDIGYKISTSGQRYGIISNYNDTSGCLSVEVNNGSSVTNNKVRLFYRASSDYNLYSSNTMNISSFNDIKITSNGSGTLGIDLNGTITTGTTSGSYANASAYLFIDRSLRWTTFSNNSFISYCKIYESGTLVRDMIPCYRKSDSVIGLYDLVNNQFYTNSGTGTFTKGSDVNNYYEKEMKNAYIGEVWTPGSNTMLYLPFSDDLNDHSSNQTSTKGGTVSITTLDGVNCANFNSGYLTFPSKKWFNTNWTISLFVKNPNNTTSGTSSIFLTSGVGGAGTECGFLWNVIDSPYYINSSTYGSARNNYVRYGYAKPSGWTHLVATQQGLTGKLYVNGTLVATNSSFSDNNITANTLYIGNNTDEPAQSKWWLKAYLSELIIENTARDATKVAHYLDIIKANYGIN